MQSHPITLDQLRRHIIQVTYHILPAIVFREEKAHLQSLAEELNRKFPQLFQKANANPDGMQFQAVVDAEAGTGFESLHLTTDAMQLTLPVEFRQADGEVLFSMPDYRAVIAAVQPSMFRHFVGRKRMRVDVMRLCFFETGGSAAQTLLTRRGPLSGIPLVQAGLTLHFDDTRFRMTMNLARGGARTGNTAGAPDAKNPGLQATVLVHHTQSRPLDDREITAALDRADDIWPEQFLTALNGSEE